MADGLVAVAATKAQADAAVLLTAPVPTGAAARDVTLAECGVALTLPGASWTATVTPPRPSAEGRRVAATIASRLHAADVRVEWDPEGLTTEVAPKDRPEQPLLDRLRAVSPDARATGRPTVAKDLPGAWRLEVRATVRGEPVRTLVLVAERGTARVTVLATAPETAWADARDALEAIVSSFRWL
jgi:hypothetical protein